MEILKFVQQDISEACFRLRIIKGLRNEFHRSMLQLNPKLNLQDWLEYVSQLDTINYSFNKSETTSYISNITQSNNDNPIIASSSRCHQIYNKHIDKTADKLRKHLLSQSHSKQSLRVPDNNYICFHCEGKGHYRHNCPHHQVERKELEIIRQRNKRNRSNNRGHQSEGSQSSHKSVSTTDQNMTIISSYQ